MCTLFGSFSHDSYICSTYTEELPLRNGSAAACVAYFLDVLAGFEPCEQCRHNTWNFECAGLERPVITVFTRYITSLVCENVLYYVLNQTWGAAPDFWSLDHMPIGNHTTIWLWPCNNYVIHCIIIHRMPWRYKGIIRIVLITTSAGQIAN